MLGGLNHNPLDFVQGNLIARAIVQLRGTRRFVRRDRLRVFNRPAVLQVSRDAGCPEGVAADLRRKIADTVVCTPMEEVGDRAAIGSACVRVADVGGKELDEAPVGAITGARDESLRLSKPARRFQQRPQPRYAARRRRLIGTKRISTRLLRAAAMRRSIDSECPS